MTRALNAILDRLPNVRLDPTLPPGVPIVRFMDEELAQRMSDYVLQSVLLHHRLFTRYNRDQKTRAWRQYYPAPAWDVNVGIMGLGQLGLDAIKHLKVFGYRLRGWSRSAELKSPFSR